ncbi:hypothetical protein HanXRQr2_Chr06g0262321 [Helianthus annuus]|uniref:Uncharacterized protein n=1 Tax=Helianthus annuus TaxID=4232 RepID=A0A251UJV8_HELAN|nr:hypothetical protein HanXRQr2_Chr06g0262321 [Helianthus annuus]KAJ0915709.1 hypothetical protein HanPSC8_Chr06g0253001 [Helianthus annuus]
MKQSDLNFEKSYFFTSNSVAFGLQFGGWGRDTRVFVESTQNERENELYLAANAYGGLGHRPGRENAYFY